jgi:Mat/Ecp fimbriae major subunit
MKIQMLKAAIAGSVLATAAFGATVANAATATGTARATILRQVTVTNTRDLDFGTIVRAATADTVSVDTAGVVTCGTSLVCAGTTTSANFNVAGTTGQVVTFSVPTSITLASGANTMTASLSPTSATQTLVANAGSFQVGGTLNVGANQADGAYSTTFTATVNYQ